MSYDKSYDVEKKAHSTEYDSSSPTNRHGLIQHHGKLMTEDGAVPGETFEIGDSFYAKAMRFAGKFNIEQRGIERVPEDERFDKGFKGLLNAGTMVSEPYSSRRLKPQMLIGIAVAFCQHGK